jgi:hypothetical protein
MNIFRVFLPIFISFFLFSRDSITSASTDLISQNTARGLIPRIFLKKDWDVSQKDNAEEIEGEIWSRTNRPIAKLHAFNDNFKLNKVLSLKLPKIGLNLEKTVSQGEVSYTVISSSRYVINGKDVFLTTCWMSPMAQNLTYNLDGMIFATDGAVSGDTFQLKNKVRALSFHNPTSENLKNQVVFIWNKEYYISIGSQMELVYLKKLLNEHFIFE